MLLAVIPAVIAALAAITAAIMSYVNGLRVNKLTALAVLDKAVHEERLKAYPNLFGCTAPFALYFSQTDLITQDVCRQVGEALSWWYFKEGGLLLSSRSRDAYFLLARALTNASMVAGKPLNARSFASERGNISSQKMKDYQTKLGLPECPTIEDADRWMFGDPSQKERDTKPEERLRDFIFLHLLTSRLRTALSDDLRSRIAPGGGAV